MLFVVKGSILEDEMLVELKGSMPWTQGAT